MTLKKVSILMCNAFNSKSKTVLAVSFFYHLSIQCFLHSCTQSRLIGKIHCKCKCISQRKLRYVYFICVQPTCRACVPVFNQGLYEEKKLNICCSAMTLFCFFFIIFFYCSVNVDCILFKTPHAFLYRSMLIS